MMPTIPDIKDASAGKPAHGRLMTGPLAIALCALGTTAAMAQSAPTGTTDLQTLRGQVEQLQRQIDQLQAQQNAQAGAAPASAPAPTAAAAPTSGPAAQVSGPSFREGPVTIAFGGFTELAVIARDRNESADVGSNFNTSIPFPNSVNSHVSEFRESARQSRLSILAQGPTDGNLVAQAYFEMDFLGAAPTANSNESNSYNLRMRNIYATFLQSDSGFYLLAGQNWSLATMYKHGLLARDENTPVTIDAQYATGFNWTRNPQLRFVEVFNRAVSAGISFESPQAQVFNGTGALPANTVYNNAGGSLFASTNNYTLDPAPDVVAKVAFDPGFGHYEIYGLGRWFRDRAAGSSNTVGGGGIGGAILLPLVPKVLDFQISALAGNGIGRYGTSGLPDVTLRPNGKLETISEYDVLLGLLYHPIPSVTLYTYVGEEHAQATAFDAVVGGTTVAYGYGNPLYDNSGCLIYGSSKCAANTRAIEQANFGGWWKYYEGPVGNLQFGLQVSYTKRETFAGIGGDPSTNMTVGMASFRYYPYQK